MERASATVTMQIRRPDGRNIENPDLTGGGLADAAQRCRTPEDPGSVFMPGFPLIEAGLFGDLPSRHDAFSDTTVGADRGKFGEHFPNAFRIANRPPSEMRCRVRHHRHDAPLIPARPIAHPATNCWRELLQAEAKLLEVANELLAKLTSVKQSFFSLRSELASAAAATGPDADALKARTIETIKTRQQQLQELEVQHKRALEMAEKKRQAAMAVRLDVPRRFATATFTADSLTMPTTPSADGSKTAEGGRVLVRLVEVAEGRDEEIRKALEVRL